MNDIIQRVPPLPFKPDFEQHEKDEEETTASMIESLKKIADTTKEDTGRSLRSVHAKSHGFIRGELIVPGNLPPELAQGMFSIPATYPTVLRFSTIPGDLLDDSVSLPRGLGMKIFGVDGPRLPGSEGDCTQDFVLVNGPAFASSNAKHFLMNLKLLASTTDKAEPLKKAFSAVLRGVEKAVEAVGGKSPTLVTLGGQPETNILGESFYSQVPILFGKYVAKIGLFPVSPELTALTGAPLSDDDKPNAIRAAMLRHFQIHGGEWEVRVQLLTDLEAMPVEDASVAWPEDKSPYRAVASLRVKPQVSWSAVRAEYVDGQLAFSPWHGLAAHRPLGSVMRVRKAVYEVMSKRRGARPEPADLMGMPD
jgi:hypothetical protein